MKARRKNMLSYEKTGRQDSKATLVFLHGSTMTKEGMLPLAKEFGDYNCVVFDLTAHGQSDGEEPEEVSVFAEDVENSVIELQKQGVVSGKIILLGYSMGGAITCEIAIRKNLELAGIVLLSSGGDLKHYTPLIDSLKEMPAEQFRTEDIVDTIFGIDTPEADMERITELFLSTKAKDVTGYGDLLASNRYDHLEACGEILVPAMMVHGNNDKVVLPMAAVETWKRIKGSQLLMIPNKGHAAIYEDTNLVRDKVLSFIEMCA